MPILATHPCKVTAVHVRFLALYLSQLLQRPFYRGFSVALASPSVNVRRHFLDPPLLLVDIVTQSALVWLVDGVVNKFEPARLSCPIFLVALLLEQSPAPVCADPTSLVEVAHAIGRLRS